jgi:hypothetical protein
MGSSRMTVQKRWEVYEVSRFAREVIGWGADSYFVVHLRKVNLRGRLPPGKLIMVSMQLLSTDSCTDEIKQGQIIEYSVEPGRQGWSAMDAVPIPPDNSAPIPSAWSNVAWTGRPLPTPGPYRHNGNSNSGGRGESMTTLLPSSEADLIVSCSPSIPDKQPDPPSIVQPLS